MKIGLLAFSSNTGLGYQTLDFAKNIECERVLIADLSKLNHMPVHHDRYEDLTDNIRISDGIPNYNDIDWLTDDVDMVFLCETPLNWELFNVARQKGVKTIMQYNYEFLNYFRDINLPKPDVLASPSYWEMERVQELRIAKVRYLPVPIDIDKVPNNNHKELKTITHVMGRPAVHDRNGTELFLKAIRQMGKAYQYQLFIQTPKEAVSQEVYNNIKPLLDNVSQELGDHLQITYDAPEVHDLYKDGSLMILPRRYGGLCLPLWEALSAGMPVIMPDISPNNKVLPEEWLVDGMKSGVVHTHSEIPMYSSSVVDIISRVTYIKNNYKQETKRARDLAESMSWESQKPKYMSLFEEICQ
jgi:glycosyltransferase involved in cell wall biosynthesis